MGNLIARSGDLFKQGNYDGWRYTATIADGESDTVKILPSGRGITLGTAILVCGSNTGRIDVTFDSVAEIDANTAEWIEWDKGEVTGTEVDVFKAIITAIRAVSVSGEITFKLVI